MKPRCRPNLAVVRYVGKSCSVSCCPVEHYINAHLGTEQFRATELVHLALHWGLRGAACNQLCDCSAPQCRAGRKEDTK